MPSARFTTTAHAAVAATDKIPALKSTTKGHLTPPFFWPPGHLYGLTLANGTDATNDINIAAGSCLDSTNVVPMSLSALVKQLDAGWAAGTNQGMRNSARAIANSTYHIFAVCKAGGADPDIYALDNTDGATAAAALTALQAETGGADYAYARRIGSILRESSAIIAFVQDGDRFMRTVGTAVNANNPGTSAVTVALARQPLGINVTAILSAWIANTTPVGAFGLITDLANADTTPSATLKNFGSDTDNRLPGLVHVRTNTSAQIRYRVAASDANLTVTMMSLGWIDTRGRLG